MKIYQSACKYYRQYVATFTRLKASNGRLPNALKNLLSKANGQIVPMCTRVTITFVYISILEKVGKHKNHHLKVGVCVCVCVCEWVICQFWVVGLRVQLEMWLLLMFKILMVQSYYIQSINTINAISQSINQSIQIESDKISTLHDRVNWIWK